MVRADRACRRSLGLLQLAAVASPVRLGKSWRGAPSAHVCRSLAPAGGALAPSTGEAAPAPPGWWPLAAHHCRHRLASLTADRIAHCPHGRADRRGPGFPVTAATGCRQ